MRFTGSKDIKDHVYPFLVAGGADFRGKVVVDVPAGSGESSAILRDLGADVRPLDLFPDLFQVEGLRCEKADLAGVLPVDDGAADVVLFQEGIEHLADQIRPLREFNRILKTGGSLIVTTPNESMLRSRLGRFLSESEYSYKTMPPNEIDSIWYSGDGEEIYYGHIFSIGIQKLRVLARIAGFRLKRIIGTRVNGSSFLLFLLLYPLLFLVNFAAYRRALRKARKRGVRSAEEVYREVYRLSVDPRLLLSGHLFVEFEKETEAHDVSRLFHGRYEAADFVT